MFKQALVSLMFVLSAITFNNAYACQENGCSGTVFGPVSIGGVHEIDGKMYIVALIEDTTKTEKNLPSGADDDVCRYGDNNWLVVRPLTTVGPNALKSDAILRMISTNQAAQSMLFHYTFNAEADACIITSVGYVN